MGKISSDGTGMNCIYSLAMAPGVRKDTRPGLAVYSLVLLCHLASLSIT